MSAQPEIPTGRCSPSPGQRARPAGGRRDRLIYYQYRAKARRRTLRGIDRQVAKAEKAMAGKAAVKHNRFVQLSGGTHSVNRTLEAKAGALAGLKGDTSPTSLPARRRTCECRVRSRSEWRKATCGRRLSTTASATRSKPT